ncbi:MAG: pilus assembly protein PilM, partial [Oscillospiraceae bacterium]|nr:pilus assembly protein PilM [Oscillospiraceae bacterium]
MSKKLSGKALVIQLGRDEVRVAQTVLGSALPQLQQCRVLPMPEGAVADGVIESPDALRDTLTGVLREPEFKRCRRADITLCSTQE